MNFLDFLFGAKTGGLGTVLNKYYGIYKAHVEDNKDPEKRGRIIVTCYAVGHDAPLLNKWVLPAFCGAGNQRGMYFPPEIGDTVWIAFTEGDPSEPEVYWGGWFGDDMPSYLTQEGEFPEKRGIVSRAGHALIFNDTAGKESFTIIWNKPDSGDPATSDRNKTAAFNPKVSSIFTFDKNGSLMIKTPNSNLLQIDDTNNTFTLTNKNGTMFHISDDDSMNLLHKSGASIAIGDGSIDISGNTGKGMNVNVSGVAISLNGGGVNLGSKALDFSVLGLKLVIYLTQLCVWASTHFHLTALGPTLPAAASPTGPAIPPTPVILSKTVKVQD